MPEIKRDKQQEKALAEVTLALNTISAIREATDEDWKGTLTLTYTIAGKSGRGSNIKVPLGDQDAKEVVAIQKLLRASMARLGKEAIVKADRFKILLSPKELAILSGEAPAPKEEPTPAAPMQVEPVEPTHEEPAATAEEHVEPVEPTQEPQESAWGAFEEAGPATTPDDDGGFADALQAFQSH